MPENILLIDKPKGITSFDVIRRLRRELGIKKMGHGGTLDPLASGLMIIGVEKGTKKLSNYLKLDKEYIAEIRLGERRSTGDLEGVVLESKEVPELDAQYIQENVQSLVGTHTLPVSAYSAIKKDGVPMYKRARKAEAKGELIADVPVRDMSVYEAELLATTLQKPFVILTMRFKVASGTYIRSLAEELGTRLGYPATLQNLRRTKIGVFDIENARSI